MSDKVPEFGIFFESQYERCALCGAESPPPLAHANECPVNSLTSPALTKLQIEEFEKLLKERWGNYKIEPESEFQIFVLAEAKRLLWDSGRPVGDYEPVVQCAWCGQFLRAGRDAIDESFGVYLCPPESVLPRRRNYCRERYRWVSGYSISEQPAVRRRRFKFWTTADDLERELKVFRKFDLPELVVVLR